MFHRDSPTDPTAVIEKSAGADSTTAVEPASNPVTTPKKPKPSPKKTPEQHAPPADTAHVAEVTPPDTVAGPLISVRMTPEEKTERLAFYVSESLRAAKALEAIRNKSLTQLQQDQMASADRFLSEARSANEAEDLHRACTLAEKARIIAEDLEKNVDH